MAILGATPALAQPQIDTDYTGQLEIRSLDNGIVNPGRLGTQMVLGGGPTLGQQYLYVSGYQGVKRYDYNPVTGLSNETTVSSIVGNGIALRTNGSGQQEMYLSSPYQSSEANDSNPSNPNELSLSRLWRVTDTDADGDFFDAGGSSQVAIVQGIPRADHGLNQIQISGNSLFVGNGVRTRNGDTQVQPFSNDTFGESAYGGAILTIANLDGVANTDNAAGFFAENPNASQYQASVQTDASPYTTTDDTKLRVLASGARNPYGLALDAAGNVFITHNQQRAENDGFDRTNTGANADQDGSFGGDGFADDIHDGFYRIDAFDDLGYRNSNWQSDATAQAAGFFTGSTIEASITFDNWATPGAANETDTQASDSDPSHDTSDPDGLGPHSSSNGFDFYDSLVLNDDFDGLAFVTRWNGRVSDNGDVLEFRDIVTVDPITGEVDRVAFDFENPIDVLDDGFGNLLVLDYRGGVYALTPVPEPATLAMLALGMAPLLRRRR